MKNSITPVAISQRGRPLEVRPTGRLRKNHHTFPVVAALGKHLPSTRRFDPGNPNALAGHLGMTGEPFDSPAKQDLVSLAKDLSSELHAIIACIVYCELMKRAGHHNLVRELEYHVAEEFQHANQITTLIECLVADQS
jgi:hypothetical protein